jgi:phosphoribosyl 1,2-cyclic phosphate phosphodiesterase
MFDYIFTPDPDYQGGLLANLILNEIDEVSPFIVNGIEIKPFRLGHGKTPVTGFRIGDTSYATDCKELPAETKATIAGSRYLILDGLRHKAHRTHLTVEEAIELSKELKIERTYLTHMTHDLDYDELKGKLPDNIEPAYDGLEIPITL